jgi:hypothetical protein
MTHCLRKASTPSGRSSRVSRFPSQDLSGTRAASADSALFQPPKPACSCTEPAGPREPNSCGSLATAGCWNQPGRPACTLNPRCLPTANRWLSDGVKTSRGRLKSGSWRTVAQAGCGLRFSSQTKRPRSGRPTEPRSSSQRTRPEVTNCVERWPTGWPLRKSF